MSRGRWAVRALAGAALAGVAGTAGLAWVAWAHSDRLLPAVGRALGREVRAERLGITLRGGIGVVLRGVTIADEPDGTGEPLVAARSLELRLRLLPLLRRRVVVDRILVDEPVLTVVRDPAGRLNVDSLGRPPGEPASAPPGPRAEPPDGKAGGPPAIQLALVRLRHGTLRYRDRGTGRALELTDVALDAREPHFGGQMPVALRAQLAATELRLEDIVSEGVLDLSDGRMSYRGTMHAGPGALGTLPLKRVEAAVQLSPPVLTLELAAVELLGGAIRGRGRLASGGDGPGLSAAVDGQDLDLARLPAREGRPHPAGVLALHAELTGPPPGGSGFAAALVGAGRFEVHDGRVEDLALGRTVRDLLAPLLGADTAGRLRQRYPDLFGGDELRFTRLAGTGRLRGGRIASDDLVLAAPSYEARGGGSLGLDGDVDLSLRLVAGSALTDDLLGRSRARPVLVDARGQLTVPLRIRGPLRHPAVTPDPEFASTVARSLLAGTGLGEVAGGVLERLLGPRRGR